MSKTMNAGEASPVKAHLEVHQKIFLGANFENRRKWAILLKGGCGRVKLRLPTFLTIDRSAMARFASRRSKGCKKGGLPVTKTELKLSKDLCTISTVADGPSHPKRAPTVRQAMILNYHVLIKKQAALQTELDSLRKSDENMTGPGVVKSSSREAASAIKDQLEAIQKQISASGGLKVYQQCSDKGGNTSNVLISWLVELNVHQTSRKVRCVGTACNLCIRFSRTDQDVGDRRP